MCAYTVFQAVAAVLHTYIHTCVHTHFHAIAAILHTLNTYIHTYTSTFTVFQAVAAVFCTRLKTMITEVCMCVCQYVDTCVC